MWASSPTDGVEDVVRGAGHRIVAVNTKIILHIYSRIACVIFECASASCEVITLRQYVVTAGSRKMRILSKPLRFSAFIFVDKLLYAFVNCCEVRL